MDSEAGNPGALLERSRSAALILAFIGAAIASVAAGQVITEFPILSYNPHPVGITSGPDGNLWFTETFGIARITTAGVITEFMVPGASGLNPPISIAAGADGNLWFTQGGGTYWDGNVGRITTGGAATVFSLPLNSRPGGIAAGSDGNLWFTQRIAVGNVSRITTAGVITEFTLPPNRFGVNITAGPDGDLWLTEQFNDTFFIGRITTGGVMTEFALPPSKSALSIVAGPDGNLWFTGGTTDSSGFYIARITTAGVITEFTLPSAGGGISAGPDGNIWFTEVSGKIGRITLAGAITEFSLPQSFSMPVGITAGPDGALWFTERDFDRIGRITVPSIESEPRLPIDRVPNLRPPPIVVSRPQP
jgi:streptogramin lyase